MFINNGGLIRPTRSGTSTAFVRLVSDLLRGCLQYLMQLFLLDFDLFTAFCQSLFIDHVVP